MPKIVSILLYGDQMKPCMVPASMIANMTTIAGQTIQTGLGISVTVATTTNTDHTTGGAERNDITAKSKVPIRLPMRS